MDRHLGLIRPPSTEDILRRLDELAMELRNNNAQPELQAERDKLLAELSGKRP